MDIQVFPGKVKGKLIAPSSKSFTQRAFAAALLRRGISIIKNAGSSKDELAALEIIQKLGAVVENAADNSLKITSSFPDTVQNQELQINFGESGLSSRIFPPIAALRKGTTVFNAEESLLHRPLLFDKQFFNSLNVAFRQDGDSFPYSLSGPMQTQNIEIDGGRSSQFLSGLLMAYAFAGARDKTIKVHALKSRPYVDITLKVLKDFGLTVPENKNYETFYFPVDSDFAPTEMALEYCIEGDWSNAAFLLVAAAISGSIVLNGLNLDSVQGDRKILEVLETCGAGVSYSDTEVKVEKGVLNSFYFDATHCPDLFPPLVALAANCTGISLIKGVSRLRAKESNRALTLQHEFKKLGLNIGLEDDCMRVEGCKLSGGVVDSCNDHRIVMACAVAALRADEPVTIHNSQAVEKSYPRFFEDLNAMGVQTEAQ